MAEPNDSFAKQLKLLEEMDWDLSNQNDSRFQKQLEGFHLKAELYMSCTPPSQLTLSTSETSTESDTNTDRDGDRERDRDRDRDTDRDTGKHIDRNRDTNRDTHTELEQKHCIE